MFGLKMVLSESCSWNTFQRRPVAQVGKCHRGSKPIGFLRRVVSLLFVGLVSVSAHASITCNNQSGSNQTLAAGSISVPANTAVGTTISTLAPITYTEQCKFINSSPNPTETTATNTAYFKTTAALVAGQDVYQTGIPGLGVRFIFNAPACNATNVVMTGGTAAVPCVFNGPVGGAFMLVAITVTAQLVVTGPIQGGISNLTTVPTVVISFITTDNATSWPQGNLYSGAATGMLTRATCSVSQSNTYVSLATADTRAFAAGSGTVFAPTPFSLSLACSAGAKVSITLTDSVNPANRSSTLQPTTDSTATGVGIQVLNSSGPVSFGADSATPGNTNQWLIGDSPNGVLQVPLTARYISTGPVTAGTVKALATFTLSYQ